MDTYDWHWKEIKTARGEIHRIRRFYMPRIDPDVLDTVFYLYESEEDARNGTNAGGTGFFVSVPSKNFPDRRPDDVYAITCKHLVKPRGGHAQAYPVIRVNTTVNRETGREWNEWRTDIFPLTPDDWKSFESLYPGENHDLAIYEMRDLTVGQQVRFIRGPFLTWVDYKERVVGHGDDVYMVGRYIDYDGKVRNIHSVRFGNISILPDSTEPLINLEGYEEPSFVVELRTLEGYSGSPVILYRIDETRRHAHPYKLLGIQWSRQPHQEYVEAVGRYVEVFSGMTNVIPAWHIQRMLDWEEFAMHRAQADAEFAGTPLGKAKMQVPTSTQKPPEDDTLTEQEFFDVLDKAISPFDEDESSEG